MTIDENHPFSSFGLSDAMLVAITRKGWTAPSSIQAIALPRLLADEGHLIVKARTGTGKTAAFGIPLIEKITQASHTPRALILTPTRELALQVSREIGSLVSGSYPRVTAVYGGASIRNQILDLRRGTEIVVGTPGRIMDLMERKALDLSAVDWFILDEADEMLDMGFFEDVEKILAAVRPADQAENSGEIMSARPLRITLFSATMPEAILKVVRRHIGEAEILVDTAPDDEKPLVDQFCMIVRREDKLEALRRIIDGAAEFYGLIFCATKVETDELARRLVEAGYPAEAIHGDLSQEIRERTLRRFRLHRAAASNMSGEAAILVATDVAARGLDIEGLTHVINWDLPNDGETYVHRIGRTGRAGRRGIAISIALPVSRGRIQHLSRAMERSLGSPIQWLKIPPVKSVMKAVRRRITAAVIAALPEPEIPASAITANSDSGADAPDAPAIAAEVLDSTVTETAAESPAAALAASAATSPFLSKVCRELIERLGPEGAVQALVSLSYGELLDPERYGPVTEFSEEDFREPGRGRHERVRNERGRPAENRRGTGSAQRSPAGKRNRAGREMSRWEKGGAQDCTRVYVGLGRRHGAGARDIAALLTRAGGIPGRLVDEIEMKDYCSFATLPADAAKRACAFSRNEPDDPVIRPSHPPS
ncbi:MAG: DEAD/DEAH box helicase [Treponema sp.]|jgi:ATP-dependent RNA helicase DeaD|nr:DEAD/DEAH box helicase [Treponema sp.]